MNNYTKILLIIFILLIGIGIIIINQFKDIEYYKDSNSIANKIKHLDEVLTMSARMSAFTGEEKWKKRYDKNVLLLDEILKTAKKDKEILAYINTIDIANNKLVEIEEKSFILVKNKKLKEAQNILFNNTYEKYKKEYSKGLNNIISYLNNKYEIEKNQLLINYKNTLLLIMSLIIFVSIFLFFINLILQRYNNKLKIQTKEISEIANKFSFASDNALAGSWEIDLYTNKVTLSDGWFNFLGYKKEEFSEVSTEEVMKKIVYEPDFELVKENVERFLKGEIDKYDVKFRILHKDGTFRWINTVGTIYKNKFFGFHIDINDLKNANLKIIEQRSLASMGEMIGNIAHQWRQPLSVISTASSGIKYHKEFGTLTDDYLFRSCQTITDNTKYLSETINVFKNFIKGDSKKGDFILKKSIETLIGLVKPTIQNNKINLILDIEEDIEIDGYENDLIQCLINIFNNSKDALLENDPETKLIFISTSSIKDKAIIKFKDNAGGIQESILYKIYEPYFTTKHQSQGTGLGLHITRSLIIEGMQGELESKNISYTYENTNHIGAEFIIKIPKN